MISFFENAPADIIQHIFSFLELRDLTLSITRLSKRLRVLGLDHRLWAALFAKNSGVVVVADQNVLEKFILYYLFQKAVHYSRDRTTDKGKPLFIEVRKRLEVIEKKLTVEDKPWIAYLNGEMLYRGYGCKADVATGLRYLFEAVELGNRDAMFSLACIHLDFSSQTVEIVGFRPNFAEAKKLLLKAVAGNNRDAVFLLACFYDEGMPSIGIEVNKEMAILLFKRAANNGHAESSLKLGELYLKTAAESADLLSDDSMDKEFESYMGSLDRSCLKENFYKINTDIEKYAIEGSRKAAKYLVELFEQGLPELDFPIDKDKAKYFTNLLNKEKDIARKDSIFWLDKSMRQGNKNAALKLAAHYLTEESDLIKGLECLKRAASLGSSQAAYQLADIYSYGTYGHRRVDIKININESIKWLEQGTKTNSDFYSQECARRLACVYKSKELGFTPDLNKVLYWYNKGIALGSIDCQIELGMLFLLGNGTLGLESNPAREEELTKAFCQDGFPYSNRAFKIAQAYYDQTPVSLAQYIKWHIRGILMSERDCVLTLRNLFKRKNEKLSNCLDNLLEQRHCGFMFDVAVKQVSSQEAISIAKQCYEALKLPVIEDDFLLTYKRNELAISQTDGVVTNYTP